MEGTLSAASLYSGIGHSRAMRETEVKVIEIDRGAVVRKLELLGGEVVFDGMMHAVFLDHPDGSIVGNGNLLRLRSAGERTVMTFKGFVSRTGVKVMEEVESEVSDMGAALAVLQAIGLVVIRDMEKHRTSYRLGKAHVDIDRYVGKHAHIPEFLEIEAEDLEEITAIARKLGFSPERLLPWSTKDLLDHYARGA